MPKKVAISVVIPAFNEEKYIWTVLNGLKAQTFKDFETIVVDGGSSDKTRKIARTCAKVIIEPKRGIGRARNKGACAAYGKIIVFLDADTKPCSKLLETYYGALQKKGVIAATGPILPLEKSGKRMNLGYRIVSVLFVKLSILLGRPSIVGLNFAVRRDAFRKVGGFNNKFITYEDWDLSLRLRKAGNIRFMDDAVVQTSTRRIKAWGVFGFFTYHIGNIFRYQLFRKPKDSYEPIR